MKRKDIYKDIFHKIISKFSINIHKEFEKKNPQTNNKKKLTKNKIKNFLN